MNKTGRLPVPANFPILAAFCQILVNNQNKTSVGRVIINIFEYESQP